MHVHTYTQPYGLPYAHSMHGTLQAWFLDRVTCFEDSPKRHPYTQPYTRPLCALLWRDTGTIQAGYIRDTGAIQAGEEEGGRDTTHEQCPASDCKALMLDHMCAVSLRVLGYVGAFGPSEVAPGSTGVSSPVAPGNTGVSSPVARGFFQKGPP